MLVKNESILKTFLSKIKFPSLILCYPLYFNFYMTQCIVQFCIVFCSDVRFVFNFNSYCERESMSYDISVECVVRNRNKILIYISILKNAE